MHKQWLVLFYLLFVAASVSYLSAQTIVVPVDSVKGPICVCMDTIHNVAVPLSPKNSKYNAVVTDGIAKVSLTQMYVNDYGDIQDLLYVFPLPHEAAVHEMIMEYNGLQYTAEIYEKEEAKELYDSISESGGKAALLLQDRPNVFQQRIANVAFHDTAWVRISFTMPLSYDNGTYEFVLPTMVAERFQSENSSTVLSSGRLWNPPADRNGQTLQINVLLQTGFQVTDIESPTHPLYIGSLDELREDLEKEDVIESTTDVESADSRGILLENAAVYPNKDFVLRFSRTNAEMDYTIATYYDTLKNSGYFFGTIFPDTALFSGERANLDVVLLVDISGSQEGWPITKEKEIANTIINRLNDKDRLSILSFNTQVVWCFNENETVQATGDNRNAGCSFVNNLVAGGGTNLLSGVQRALEMPLGDGFQRFFIFLTDGDITNEAAILSEIKEHPTAPTVFTFGAGNNLNRYFLDEAAKVGNGVSTEITSAENAEEVVLRVWEKIESPQLMNVGITCEAFNTDDLLLPNGTHLYKGTPLAIYGTYTEGGDHPVTVTGYRDGEKVEFKKTIKLANIVNSNGMVAQMWAKQMIQYLRNDEGTTTANKEKIVTLSKQYQVLSDYTAFLAFKPVEVTEDNSIATGVDAVQVRRAAALEQKVMIHQFPDVLIIEAVDGAVLQEIVLYDIRGRCIVKINLAAGQTYFRCRWNQLLKGNRRLARGQYILTVRTNVGQLKRLMFMR